MLEDWFNRVQHCCRAQTIHQSKIFNWKSLARFQHHLTELCAPWHRLRRQADLSKGDEQALSASMTVAREPLVLG